MSSDMCSEGAFYCEAVSLSDPCLYGCVLEAAAWDSCTRHAAHACMLFQLRHRYSPTTLFGPTRRLHTTFKFLRLLIGRAQGVIEGSSLQALRVSQTQHRHKCHDSRDVKHLHMPSRCIIKEVANSAGTQAQHTQPSDYALRLDAKIIPALGQAEIEQQIRGSFEQQIS